ncbi:hypothetical protein Q0M98_18975 [Rossellomorea marisflavi]
MKSLVLIEAKKAATPGSTTKTIRKPVKYSTWVLCKRVGQSQNVL